MTDSNQISIAAYRWRDSVGVDQASINDPKKNSFAGEYNEDFGRDKLLRLEDITQLIVHVQNQYSMNQEWDDNSEKQAIVDSLIEELLLEIEKADVDETNGDTK